MYKVTDIAVDDMRDITVTGDGDIVLEQTSITQAIRTRLLWIYGEWRLGPSLGFPWFEDMLVKNPNTDRLKADIRNAVMDVDGITDCTVEVTSFDRAARRIRFTYTAYTDGGTVSEEVEI